MMKLKPSDLKVAKSPMSAKWTKLLEMAEEEKLALQCQVEINKTMIALAKKKVMELER